jgi:uncharacterized protein YndB with AHSA1/START domain
MVALLEAALYATVRLLFRDRPQGRVKACARCSMEAALSALTLAAKAEMLIRRPAAVVFEAFVEPAITSRFWFSRGSARLETGKSVRWDWEMYGFSIDARVKELEPNARLVVEWTGYGYPTDIAWLFTDRPDGTTFVSVTNTGFRGAPEEVAELAVGATEGFAFVLAGAKALLEHGVELRLVPDRFPDGLPKE